MPQKYADTAIRDFPFAVLASMTKHHDDEDIRYHRALGRAVRLAEEMDDDCWSHMDDSQEIDEILYEELGTTLDTMN